MNLSPVRLHFLAGLCAVLVLLSCSKSGHVEIDLGNSHLEQTPAGQWLSAFHLKYGPGADPIKKQIAEELRANGTLVEKYTQKENANNVMTMVWKYRGKTILEQYFRGGIWEGPKIIPYQEYYQGELAVWLTLDLGEGVSYAELLPNHDHTFQERRELEHAATIKSSADNARLFLFGHGTKCERISLF